MLKLGRYVYAAGYIPWRDLGWEEFPFPGHYRGRGGRRFDFCGFAPGWSMAGQDKKGFKRLSWPGSGLEAKGETPQGTGGNLQRGAALKSPPSRRKGTGQQMRASLPGGVGEHRRLG